MHQSSPETTAAPSTPNSAIYYALAIIALCIAPALAVGVVMMDEVRDLHGEIVRDLNGEPQFTINRWQTWMVNWPTHCFMAIALVLFTIPTVRHLRQLYRWLTGRNQ